MVSTDKGDTKTSDLSAVEQLSNAGIAGAAVVAASAVNQAVSMKKLSAPETKKSFVVTDGAANDRIGKVDEFGLPLVYDKNAIEKYWAAQSGALSKRWSEFLRVSVPFLTRVLTIVISKGSGALADEGADLARDARERMTELGPTYVKLGQMMSVRPDVLPESALEELRILQDSVQPFDTETAIQQIESELGGSLNNFFSEISSEPVAAASLAQVYRAKLASTGEYVAVKVQRPGCLETVSKDLYVLRRAAEVYQGLIERFAPQQRTDYVALLNEWAIGFYTELDFLNEAANQKFLREGLAAEGVTGVYIPEVNDELTTRRILVSEWMDGKKLSEAEAHQIKAVTPEAQEAFLSQLLKVGCMHADPHPGNLMYLDEPRDMPGGSAARLALLDFGLVARITKEDQDKMVSAIIHLANKDYRSLCTDFVRLEILGGDLDPGVVVPLMDKALTPYVKGGGAQRYKEEVMKTYGMDGSITGSTGGFAAMTSDALTVLQDIPFSIPPYFALLGRAIVTLEGVALTGDPNYGIIMESYPFVARKLLKEDRPELQKALQEVLYSGASDGHAQGGGGLSATRLSVLLNSALDVIKREGNAFVDFDSVPDETVTFGEALKFICSEDSRNLRDLLSNEAVIAGDLLLRQATRKVYGQVVGRVPRLPFLNTLLPRPEDVPLPVPIPSPGMFPPPGTPTKGGGAGLDLSQISPALVTTKDLLETAAPKLSLEDELYALSLVDLVKETLGEDAAAVVNGDSLNDPAATARVLVQFINGGSVSSFLPALPEGVRDAINSVASLLGEPVPSPSSPSGQPAQVTAVSTAATEGAGTPMSSPVAFQDLSAGLDGLDEAERAALDTFLAELTYRLREKLVQRLQVLV